MAIEKRSWIMPAICCLAVLASCIWGFASARTGRVAEEQNLKSLVQSYYLPNRDLREDPVEGAERLSQAASAQPNSDASAEAYYMAGVLYRQGAKWREAIAAYNAALEHDALLPLQRVSALYAISQCKRNLGDRQGAIQALEGMHELVNNSPELSSVIEKGINGEESAYFNSLYSLLASGFLDRADICLESRDYKGASQTRLTFLEWYDRLHKRKVFYKADRELGLDRSAPFVDAAARYYLRVPGGRKKALEIYSAYRNHWTATPEERFLYELWCIELAPKLSLSTTIAALENLIARNPGNEMIPQAKERLAHYAQMANNLDLAMKSWKELAQLEGASRKRFSGIVQSALLNLALHSLAKGDADSSQFYLDQISQEFRDTRTYELATKMGLWKWPEEIRTRKSSGRH